jgi:flagellar hook-basal body complex protein FliE
MVANELAASKPYLPLVQQRTDSKNSPYLPNTSFKDTVNEFMGDVNSLQKESADMTAAMIKGEPVDIHDVMISAQKAKTSFELMLELRNKFLDMYREVNRMQV